MTGVLNNLEDFSWEIIHKPILWVYICIIIINAILNAIFLSVHIEKNVIQVGWKLFSYFKPQYSFSSDQLEGLMIQQQPDRYYGIGFVLIDQQFIILDKVAVLDQAKKREKEIKALFQDKL